MDLDIADGEDPMRSRFEDENDPQYLIVGFLLSTGIIVTVRGEVIKGGLFVVPSLRFFQGRGIRRKTIKIKELGSKIDFLWCKGAKRPTGDIRRVASLHKKRIERLGTRICQSLAGKSEV